MADATAALSESGVEQDGEAAPERAIATDMARRSLIAAPVALGIGTAAWGWAGLWSVGLALVLVVANLTAGAAVITWGARRSPAVLMGAVLFGYLARLGVITAVVLPVRASGWFEVVPFAASLLLSHLGLLVWELRHVAASLAFPGLKPGHELASPFVSFGRHDP